MNRNSKGNQNDITIVRPVDNSYWPPQIADIPDDFHPSSIAIQEVLEAGNFVEAAKNTIELMPDEDFTTPSKRQVLQNKLDVIEHLIETNANEQAIISNTRVFEKDVTKFVANEVRKEELIDFAESIISSIQQE